MVEAKEEGVDREYIERMAKRGTCTAHAWHGMEWFRRATREFVSAVLVSRSAYGSAGQGENHQWFRCFETAKARDPELQNPRIPDERRTLMLLTVSSLISPKMISDSACSVKSCEVRSRWACISMWDTPASTASRSSNALLISTTVTASACCRDLISPCKKPPLF